LSAEVFQEEHQKYFKEDAEGPSPLETEKLKISGEIASQNADETQSFRARRRRIEGQSLRHLENLLSLREMQAQEEEGRQPSDKLQRRRSGPLRSKSRKQEERAQEIRSGP
jgi:hypothetical protein